MRAFDEIWTDYLEGELDEAGMSELEAHLAADNSLLERAADLYAEHRALGLLCAREASAFFLQETLHRLRQGRDEFVTSVAQRVAAQQPVRVRSRWKDYAAVAAATLLFSLVLQIILRRPEPKEPAIAVPVATLVRSDRVRWEPERRMDDGQRLHPGSLRLGAGRAVVLFDGGAIVALHGPADVEIESRGALRVRHGRVNVRAEHEAAGFTVRTPAGDVVDLGTEFVVAVEISGTTEIHVQEGEVAWNRQPGGPPSATLRAGQAIRFEAGRGEEGRTITFAAQTLEDILKERPADLPLSRPTAAEDFEYGPGEIALSQADGGFGWRRPWRLRQGVEATPEPDRSDRMLIVPESLRGSWPPSADRGGALSLPPGSSFFLRELKDPVDLSRDGAYYVSFLLRREPDAAPNPSRDPHFRLTLRSSKDFWGPSISAGLQDARRPTLQFQGRDNFVGSAEVAVGRTSLWVLKIATSRVHPDEFFLKVFGKAEPLPRFEPSHWTVTTGPVPTDASLDLVVLTGTGPATHIVDGLRFGRTWESVIRRE